MQREKFFILLRRRRPRAGSVTACVGGLALWAFRLGEGRDSERGVQPRQTDAVDQSVPREANGYKAEGFSRQPERVSISMNRNEESSLLGITSMPSISRHGL